VQRLVDTGNTVLVIEHNLDIIKVADWIVDIGPEGGNKGGTIVAEGTPEEIAGVTGSYTGHYLKQIFDKEAAKPRKAEIEPVRKTRKEKNLAAAS
jgi:excinuclease ABC subunit A